MSFVRELALAGGGVAALPSWTVARELERGALVTVLAGQNAAPPASLYLVHQGGRPMTPKLQALLDHFLRAFGVSGRRISACRR